MRFKNTKKGLAILLSIATLIGGMQVMTAYAGQSEVAIDNASFKEELDTGKWNNPDSDMEIKNGKLIISPDSTEDTRIITVQPAMSNERLSELFRASTTFKLTELPKGEKFIFAFGLASIEEYPGNPGNIEVGFFNDGGLKVDVTAYDDNGDAVVIAKPASCGAVKSSVTLSAILTSDNKLTLKVGSKTICNKKELPIESDGSLGFLQTGNCGAEISNVDISIYTYDTPENPDVFEDFETGAMNSAVFYSRNVYPSPYYPQALSVQEIDGNQVLKFDRCGLAYIGTVYQYSNFELTFDVPYFQRSEERDEEGEVIVPRTSNLLVAFGSDIVQYSDYGYTKATDTIMFPSNNMISNLRETQLKSMPASHHIYNDNDPSDKGFSIKVSVIDAEVTVGIKWEHEKKFTTVMNYMLPNGTPTGHVHIWSSDSCSFAIDNIKIVNRDKNPEAIEVEAKYDSFERIPDFDYQDAGIVYRPTSTVSEDTDAEKGLGVYAVTVYAAGAGILILAAGFVIGQVQNKKQSKKEERGISDEA